MKRSRFNQEQIIAILKEQEAGMATAEVCRRDGISFYNHRQLPSTPGYASPMAFEQKWFAGQISLAA